MHTCALCIVHMYSIFYMIYKYDTIFISHLTDICMCVDVCIVVDTYFYNFVQTERMGLYIKVDKLLFNCTNGCCILPSILQLCIHKLVAATIAENGATIVQLRRHSHELSHIACDTKVSHQSYTAQRLQRP